ncbi:hypothetical protein [Albibacterium profundi]|uniref:Type II secretion system protein GspG C-terminal domain-containing protein n=1 Tax=Albibacterium profundi TaxID=3134906 RepID=A0ABV5CF90_9SPHI
MDENISKNSEPTNRVYLPKKTKPPYLLGLLGLIPLIGFFVGVALTLMGILKYKDKVLTIIGIVCILFTVGIYSSLYYIGFKSDMGKKGWEKHAQMQLNSLIKDIEYYKLENNVYPDSLTQLQGGDQLIFINDPTQTIQKKENTYYNYKNLGDKYLLYSSGTDGIPNSADDIFPQIESTNSKTGWIRAE